MSSIHYNRYIVLPVIILTCLLLIYKKILQISTTVIIMILIKKTIHVKLNGISKISGMSRFDEFDFKNVDTILYSQNCKWTKFKLYLYNVSRI